MDLDFKKHLPVDFADNARVWIYQSSRLFSLQEAFSIEKALESFLSEWNTHGTANNSYGNLFFGQFLVFMADEQYQKVSGCSTDSSVRFVKGLEKTFSVSFFDRQSLAFIIDEKVQILPLAQLNYGLENGFIKTDTLYFNNLVDNKLDFVNKWIIPLSQSWLSNRITVK